MDYQRNEYRVHRIVYHLVWCPKRRKAVLGSAMAKDCQALIEQKGAEQGWTMLALAMQPDPYPPLRVRLAYRLSGSRASRVQRTHSASSPSQVRRPAPAALAVDEKLLCEHSRGCLARDYPALHGCPEGPVG